MYPTVMDTGRSSMTALFKHVLYQSDIKKPITLFLLHKYI